jgi:hypothetical protein
MLLIKKRVHFIILIVLLLASACSQQGFHVKQLAKSDIDMVSDIVIKDTRQQLSQLLAKFYKRNPRQLAKVPGMTIEKRQWMIFDSKGPLLFGELNHLQEVAAMNLAFDPAFKGDRVFALMVGLTGMIRQAYGYNTEFFFSDELDSQKLYNSARNIEVMSWKLRNQQAGADPIVSDRDRSGVVVNTSFERLYGKLIQKQDMMAMVIADRENRTIKTVIHSGLSVFLPI